MKTCIIIWKTQSSKNSNYYIGASYEKEGYYANTCVQVTESKFNELNIGDVVEIPAEAL